MTNKLLSICSISEYTVKGSAEPKPKPLHGIRDEFTIEKIIEFINDLKTGVTFEIPLLGEEFIINPGDFKIYLTTGIFDFKGKGVARNIANRLDRLEHHFVTCYLNFEKDGINYYFILWTFGMAYCSSPACKEEIQKAGKKFSKLAEFSLPDKFTYEDFIQAGEIKQSSEFNYIPEISAGSSSVPVEVDIDNVLYFLLNVFQKFMLKDLKSGDLEFKDPSYLENWKTLWENDQSIDKIRPASFQNYFGQIYSGRSSDSGFTRGYVLRVPYYIFAYSTFAKFSYFSNFRLYCKHFPGPVISYIKNNGVLYIDVKKSDNPILFLNKLYQESDMFPPNVGLDNKTEHYDKYWKYVETVKPIITRTVGQQKEALKDLLPQIRGKALETDLTKEEIAKAKEVVDEAIMEAVLKRRKYDELIADPRQRDKAAEAKAEMLRAEKDLANAIAAEKALEKAAAGGSKKRKTRKRKTRKRKTRKRKTRKKRK